MNLYNAFLYAAAEDSCGVSLVFDGKVILGTRARKERTKSFNAFSSVDYPEIGVIRDGRLIRYLPPPGGQGAPPNSTMCWRTGSCSSPSSPVWGPRLWPPWSKAIRP